MHASPPTDETPTARANILLAEALRYYAERRTMNNPKGWAHVTRKVESAIEGDLYQTTEAEREEARAVMRALVDHEAAFEAAAQQGTA